MEPADVDATVNSIAIDGKPSNKYTGAPVRMSEAVQAAVEFYSDENMGSIITGQTPEGFNDDDSYAIRQIKQISRTAPIALRMANELIDVASSTNLEEGLAAELQNLEGIFATKDAYEGLSSLIQGRRPTYTNE